MESVVRSGALQIQKASGLGKKFQKKYAALYRRSHHGVSRLEVYDNKDAFDKRGKKSLISLDNCITIERTKVQDGKKPDCIIKLTFNDNKEQVFQTETEQDKELWYAALSTVIFGGGSLTDNLIYEQYDEEGHDVVVRQNDIVQKLNLQGMYRLVVTDQNVELRDKSTKKAVATWPLMLLRKYGRDKQEFSLEAGRRCQTGPGMFFFVTDHYNEIFQEVDTKVRNLAQRNRTPSITTVKGKSPTTMNPPDSPLPLSPLPPVTDGVYSDPRDILLSPKVEKEPVYNEPLNAQPSVKPQHRDKKSAKPQIPSPPKPERVKKGPFGKKDKKKPTKTQVVEEATYSEAVVGGIDANGGEYGSLNFEGTPPINTDSAYDSLNVGWKGGNPSVVNESEYSTAQSISPQPSASHEDSVYDHVKH